MKFAKNHPAATNLTLSFFLAVFMSIGVNLYTPTIGNNLPLPLLVYLSLLLTIAVLAFQIWFNHDISCVRKDLIKDLLGLTTLYIRQHATTNIREEDVRVIVHIKSYVRPGKDICAQDCLVPKYWRSTIDPKDRGPIPLTMSEYKNWYINVQAFTTTLPVAREPDKSKKPKAKGFYINNPSSFGAVSVVSVPIWDYKFKEVVGTLTVDSKRPIKELKWLDEQTVNSKITNYLEKVADMISKIHFDSDSDTA